MIIPVRLNKKDALLFKNYAKRECITISELVRRCVIEHIENEYDLKVYEEAMKEFKEEPITYPAEEVWKELGL